MPVKTSVSAEAGSETVVAGTTVELAEPVRDGVIANVVSGVNSSDNDMTLLHVGIVHDVICTAATAATA